MDKILVTGASGFIGHSLCNELIKSNRFVRAAVRNIDSYFINISNKFEYFSVGNIGLETKWDNALEGINCVIHCAGIAHQMNKNRNLDAYLSVNTQATKHLAEQAVKAGVKRLIFLSSVKVNGECTDKINNYVIQIKQNNKIFTYNDLPNPQDFYAISKFNAEKLLWEISAKTGLEIVVVRLPLVYGHGVKGNLIRLIKLINYGIPLPFSLLKNRRSLIGIDNLVSLLVLCVDHLNAAGKTFLVSDGEDLSTPDLLRLIASAMNRSISLFPAPIALLKFFSFFLGKQKEINKLIGSLQVDSSYTREILNWTPPVSVEEGIRRMVKGI